MAEFNPQLPDPSNPDRDKGYIGYSEGYRPVPVQEAPTPKQFSTYADRSAEYKAKGKSDFLGSVGKLFGAAVEATDYVVKSYIENTLTDQTNAIKDEYGVGDMAIQNTDISQTPGPTPEQLGQSQKNLEGLTAAYQAGRLPESQYWARLESAVRQMKTRFPGYRSEIDSMISKLTGATPANVLLKLMRDEAEATQRSTNEEYKNSREYTEALVNSGEWNIIFPGRDPGSVSYQDMLIGVSRYREKDARYTRQAAEHKALQDESELNTQLATDQFIEDSVSDIFPKARDAALVQAGFKGGWTEYQQFLSNLAANPTPEGQDRAVKAFSAIKIATQNAIYEHKARFYSGKGDSPTLTDEDANKAINTVNSQLKVFEDYLANKDYGTASTHARAIEFMSTEAGAKVMQSNEYLRLVVGVEKTLGKDYATKLAENGENFSKVEEFFAHANAYKILNGEGGFTKLLTDAQSKKINITGKEFTQVMDETLTAITSDSTTPEQKAAAARNIFSKENRDLIGSLSDASVNGDPTLPATVYAKYTAPEVRDAMLGLREKDPQAFAMYKNFVTQSFEVVFKQDVDNLNEIIQKNDNLDVNYDPKSDVLSVNVFPSGPKSYEESVQQKNVEVAVEAFNTKLAMIKPIFEAGQTNGARVMGNFLNDIGFDQTADGRRLVKEGSFGRNLWNNLRALLASPDEGTEGPDASAQKVPGKGKKNTP